MPRIRPSGACTIAATRSHCAGNRASIAPGRPSNFATSSMLRTTSACVRVRPAFSPRATGVTWRRSKPIRMTAADTPSPLSRHLRTQTNGGEGAFRTDLLTIGSHANYVLWMPLLRALMCPESKPCLAWDSNPVQLYFSRPRWKATDTFCGLISATCSLPVTCVI